MDQFFLSCVLLGIFLLETFKCEVHKYVLQGHSIPSEFVDAELELGPSMCNCRYKCLVISCSVFEVTERSDGTKVCLFTAKNISIADLPKTSESSIAVIYSDYKLVGSQFYKLFPPNYKNYFSASDHCIQDGGQLVIVNNRKNENELRQLLSTTGAEAVWIGLFREKLGENLDGTFNFEIPRWTYNNGSVMLFDSGYTILHSINRCFDFKVSRYGDEAISNAFYCDKQLPFVCQRNFIFSAIKTTP